MEPLNWKKELPDKVGPYLHRIIGRKIMFLCEIKDGGPLGLTYNCLHKTSTLSDVREEGFEWCGPLVLTEVEVKQVCATSVLCDRLHELARETEVGKTVKNIQTITAAVSARSAPIAPPAKWTPIEVVKRLPQHRKDTILDLLIAELFWDHTNDVFEEEKAVDGADLTMTLSNALVHDMADMGAFESAEGEDL